MNLSVRTCLITLCLVSASPCFAQGDAVKGKKLFARCSACHSATAANKLGPGLAGIVGRSSGAVVGYRYSPAMVAANVTWDEATLSAFLKSPPAFLRGTKMTGGVVPKDQDREDIIAYLKTLSP